jgi:TonB family protein
MYHSIRESQVLSRRAVALGGIAGLHLLVISLIASGLGNRLVELVADPIKVTAIAAQPIVRDAPPPPANPTLRRPETDLGPKPDMVIEGDPGPGALTAVPQQPPAPSQVDPRPGPAPPIRLIGRNQLPNTSDFYPPALIRQGVEGAAVVRVCVDEKGSRRGEPAVEQSSGNARLDAGAIGVARAGQYARAMQGDTPVPVCHRIRIGFNLK